MPRPDNRKLTQEQRTEIARRAGRARGARITKAEVSKAGKASARAKRARIRLAQWTAILNAHAERPARNEMESRFLAAQRRKVAGSVSPAGARGE